MGTSEFDLAIRGGTVMSARGRAPLDVYVRDGQIQALEPTGRPRTADEVVDATGLFVFPGLVDTHVHLMDPGDTEREDFPTGSAAAIRQGVTTVIEHTHAWPVSDPDTLREKREHLKGRAYVDFGLAAHVLADKMEHLSDLWRSGVAYFKCFTCTTHGIPATTPDILYELLTTAAAIDAACLVHCEDEYLTALAERRLKAAGRSDPGVLIAWRSREAELLAVGAVALMCRLTGARTTIAHVSHAEALRLVRRERASGAPLAAETCPQYLFLREEEVLHQGALRKFTPPARNRSSDDEARMWEAFNRGAIDILSSDHAPATLDQKMSGDIWNVHFGLPGLDTTFPIMLDAALRGRTSLERLVEAYASAPARWYRLKGKGRVAVGYDADLALVDPTANRTLSNDAIASKAGWTPYEGRELKGGVVATFLRGRKMVENGALLGGPEQGRFLPGPGAPRID